MQRQIAQRALEFLKEWAVLVEQDSWEIINRSTKLADLDRLYATVAEVKRRIDIVFANAGVGEFGTPAFGIYAASKAAIRSFVRTWTSDLKDRHIRSNVDGGRAQV
jgi:NAD(P)-dependent dehydrogenase (short-subunit alcohol dehydrogenase family)